ncbi:MAG: PAS domain-containing protein, partial [Bacteroidota bacterium]
MLKNFKINITVRVILLIIVAGGLVASANARMDVLALVLLVCLGFMVANFIRYVNQTNRDLANFFASVKYDDFTANTNSSLKGASFEDLYAGFNLVNRKFRDIRAEKEANHQFLQTIVQNIEVGLLCINQDGEIILMNDALQQMLHKSYLIHLDGLKKVDKKLWEAVKDLQNGERALLKISIQNDLLQLSINAVEMRMQSSNYRLITFQNIQNELEAQELQSWQKLIRILTHEIMNSVTPISSLSSTIHSWLNDQEQVSPEQLEQIRRSSAVIEKRSEGLLRFTETYRKLTRLPPPQFQSVDIQQLIEAVVTLMQSTLDKQNIKLEEVYRNKVLKLNGDPNLLEQV